MTMFALVDCNSFYCSCERVFNPKLNGKALVVLSNNDGIIIARTDEAKALGIKMGEAVFKIRDLIRRNKVHTYSSNYSLYGDMSHRVMQTLSQFTPEMEIYSIDEAFLNLCGFQELEAYGKKIHDTILMHTGIPTSVGIGPTKVLAKVANRIAKKRKHISPVFDLSSKEVQDTVLASFPVEDIWGIARRSAAKLEALGIRTAKELRDADLDLIEKVLTIVGRRLVSELRGFSCLPLELVRDDKKEIISSRSFGKPVFALDELKEALAHYVSRASEKLREQGSVCAHLQVFVHTNPHKNVSQYFNATSLKIMTPTSATSALVRYAFHALESIYKEGIEYKKTGVILSDFRTQNIPFSLFEDRELYNQDNALTKVMDEINRTFGSHSVKLGSCGTESVWKMKSEIRSPCYTTRWKDLLKV